MGGKVSHQIMFVVITLYSDISLIAFAVRVVSTLKSVSLHPLFLSLVNVYFHPMAVACMCMCMCVSLPVDNLIYHPTSD